MKTAEEYLKESGYEEGMTWTFEGMKLNMGIFAYERDQEIKDMIDEMIEKERSLSEGDMTYDATDLLTELRSKL